MRQPVWESDLKTNAGGYKTSKTNAGYKTHPDLNSGPTLIRWEDESLTPAYNSVASAEQVNRQGEERRDQAGAHTHPRQHHRPCQDGGAWQVSPQPSLHFCDK